MPFALDDLDSNWKRPLNRLDAVHENTHTFVNIVGEDCILE
jgi:hypothetical protein